MTKRSPEREQFLADLLTTAVEPWENYDPHPGDEKSTREGWTNLARDARTVLDDWITRSVEPNGGS